MKGYRPPLARETVRSTAGLLVSIAAGLYLLSMVGLLVEGYSPDKSIPYESLMALHETGTRLVGDLGRDFIEPLGDQRYLAHSELPRIDLYVAPQHLERLRLQRDRAIAAHVLLEDAEGEVPGHIRLDGQEHVRVHVRLKGDNTDHLLHSIWSLRVTVRDGKSLFGMRRFSLQRPETRGGHTEPLLLEELRREGILAPRYRFADLLLNDRFLGTVAVEEGFSKELLESQGRRESVIVAWDEEYMWRQRRINRRDKRTPVLENPWGTDATPFDYVTTLPIKVFQESEVLKTPALRAHYREALGLARGYLAGRIDADQVFDMRRLGRFVALLHAFCVDHGLVEHNLRLYYNPVTRLFEPIGFDNDVPRDCPADPAQSRFPVPGVFGARGSDVFFESYAETARRLDAAFADGALPRRLARREAELLRPFERAGRAVDRFPFERLALRARYMTNHLPLAAAERRYHGHRPPKLVERPELSGFFAAYYVEDGARAWLELHNVVDRPIHLDAVVARRAEGEQPLPLRDGQRTVLPYLPYEEWLRIPVPAIDTASGERYAVTATLDERNRQEDVAHVSFPAFERAKYAAPGAAELLRRHAFLQPSGPAEFSVPPGDWTIDEDLILPDGYGLRIAAGATLRACQSCRVILRGPLTAIGSADRPIVMTAIDGDRGWAGVVVLAASAPSRLEHVRIESVAWPPADDWRLTGAVTFYESDLEVVSSAFVGNRTEDALNVIRSGFEIRDSRFERSLRDALDVDAGHGVVTATSFERMGGDAIDVSTSRVRVTDCRIREAGDKAISVGEGATLTAGRLRIDGVHVGIAAKDGSTALLAASEIGRVDGVAFMSYVKKPEYGPARLIVRGSPARGAPLESVRTETCGLAIDGVEVEPRALDLDRLYAVADARAADVARWIAP